MCVHVCVFPAACATSCAMATMTILCVGATASPTTHHVMSVKHLVSNSKRSTSDMLAVVKVTNSEAKQGWPNEIKGYKEIVKWMELRKEALKTRTCTSDHLSEGGTNICSVNAGSASCTSLEQPTTNLFLLLWLQIKTEKTAMLKPNLTSMVRLASWKFSDSSDSKQPIRQELFIAAMFKPGEGEEFVDSPAPCPENYEHFCEHGKCEMRHNLPTCR